MDAAERDSDGQIATARLAAAKGDWEAARIAWERARTEGGDTAFIALGHALSLLGAGRLEEAEAALTLATAAYPADAALARAYAHAADQRGDAEQAAARWLAVVALRPFDAGAYLGMAASARAGGDVEESHRVLCRASRVCSAPDLDAMRAWTALALDRTPATWAHWAAIRTLHPNHRLVALGPTRSTIDAPSLARDFASLGGNCEFGLVQRALGGEPLDLLRWASVFPASLAAVLDAGFDGFSDSDALELKLDVSGEYTMHQPRYGIEIHCFKNEGDVDPAEFAASQRQRIGLLRSKILHDLRRGTRIFVYWQPVLHPRDIEMIGDALARNFPSARLLCVSVGAEGERTPAATLLRPGLLTGKIDRDGRVGKRAGWSIATDQWLALMIEARERFAAPAMVSDKRAAA